MLLRDLRTSIELVVGSYQFPDIGSGDQPEDPESWDSNWLIVQGTVTTEAGSPWSFRQLCLTTWEVAESADWCQNVAAGLVPLLPPEARELDNASFYESIRAGRLTFTEPNLSFGVGAQSAARMELRLPRAGPRPRSLKNGGTQILCRILNLISDDCRSSQIRVEAPRGFVAAATRRLGGAAHRLFRNGIPLRRWSDGLDRCLSDANVPSHDVPLHCRVKRRRAHSG